MEKSPTTTLPSSKKFWNSTSRTSSTFGTLLVSVAVLWQGIGTAVISHSVPPELGTYATFTAFLVAGIIGILALLFNGQKSAKTPKLSAKDIVLLNLVTAGAFACFYVAATLIPATAASVIETGLGPIAVALTSVFLVKNRNLSSLRHPAFVLLAATIVAICVFAVNDANSGLRIAGIGLSVFAGLCAAGVLLISQKLAKQGISALTISATRFHLAWFICGAIAIPSVLRSSADPATLVYIALISTVAISIPILLLQWGITIAQPLHAAFIISALPAIVLLADTVLGAPLTPGIALSMTILVAVLLVGLRPKK